MKTLPAALALALASATGCGGSSFVPPPPPPPPEHDRPPLQIAVDPLQIAVDPVDPVAPDPPPIAPSCGPVALSPRLSRCAVIPSVRATATSSAGSAADAFDGSTCTIWNAGGAAPQSIMVDLGASRRIDAVVLVPEMTPAGSVVHRIEVSEGDDPRSFQSAHTIIAPMRSNVPVELPFPQPELARFVQITTDASPSWIAWREIVLLDCGGR